MTLRRFLAHLRYLFGRHGWPAAAGLVLLIVAAGLQWFWAAQNRTLTDRAMADQTALRQLLAKRIQPAAIPDQAINQLLALVSIDTLAIENVAIIHQRAEANGVKLATGEYRLVREGGGGNVGDAGGTRLLRYQIALPARATYPQLRAWLADVMNAVPTAALDELSLRRDDIGNGTVDARVRLTLFVKGS